RRRAVYATLLGMLRARLPGMTAVGVPVRATGLGSLGARLVPSALSERVLVHDDAARAFRAARHRFIGGERIDMSALAAELGVDRMSAPLPPHDVETVLVQVAESYAYSDLIAGERPDADRAAAAFALVLAPTRSTTRSTP